MKRSEWKQFISNENGRHIGNNIVLGCPVYCIRDDMGYHKNKSTIPAYVCEITEEDLPDDNYIKEYLYPRFICIPMKLLYSSEFTMITADIQMLSIIALDAHEKGLTAPCSELLHQLDMWNRSEEPLEIQLKDYIKAYL